MLLGSAACRRVRSSRGCSGRPHPRRYSSPRCGSCMCGSRRGPRTQLGKPVSNPCQSIRGSTGRSHQWGCRSRCWHRSSAGHSPVQSALQNTLGCRGLQRIQGGTRRCRLCDGRVHCCAHRGDMAGRSRGHRTQGRRFSGIRVLGSPEHTRSSHPLGSRNHHFRSCRTQSSWGPSDQVDMCCHSGCLSIRPNSSSGL